MSAPIKDGGPAFPTDSEAQVGANRWHHEGMTLRDYFAAKAMHAELLTCGVPGAARAIKRTGERPEDHMARVAYEMADAMLAAREVKA